MAVRIAARNGERSLQRDTIAALRGAYSDWLIVIHEIVANEAEQYVLMDYGYHPSNDPLLSEEMQAIGRVGKLRRVEARIRSIDPNPPTELGQISRVVETADWHADLGPKPTGPDEAC